VNRISIGCQSFDDKFLKICNREHDSQDTFNTIDLVQKYFTNYSLDLLFSLPEQGLIQLEKDLSYIREINPPHVSAYCLTLAEQHPMNKNRCSDEEQIEMFQMILNHFKKQSLERYEISNFAQKGFESRHNNLYWQDANYWGIGLSAHSYIKSPGWGTRFWNPSSYQSYMKLVGELKPGSHLKSPEYKNSKEELSFHEALTDFCHTHLRLMTGLDSRSVRQKFGNQASEKLAERINTLSSEGLITNTGPFSRLTEQGILLSNQVFSRLLFSHSDIDNPQIRPLF